MDKLIKETETHKYFETIKGIAYCVPKDTYFVMEKAKEKCWLSVRVDPALLKKLKHECISREMTMQAMIDSILRKEI